MRTLFECDAKKSNFPPETSTQDQMTPDDYKLTQSQYARVYGVTERSIRTYQGQDLPLDNTGTTVLMLMERKTRPPGLSSPEMARLAYEREAGISSGVTPERTIRLGELIMDFWHAHNGIVKFMREHNWPHTDEVCEILADTSAKVQQIDALAGIRSNPAAPDEK